MGSKEKAPGSSPSSDQGIIELFKELECCIPLNPSDSFIPSHFTIKPERELLRSFAEYTLSVPLEVAEKMLPPLVRLLKKPAENINSKTYFTNMECFLYAFHHLGFEAPNETIRLCGYKFGTGQSTVSSQEELLYEEFTARLTSVSDMTVIRREELVEQMLELDENIRCAKRRRDDFCREENMRNDTKTEMRACINILHMLKVLLTKTPSFIGDAVVKLSWKEAMQPPPASKTSIPRYFTRAPMRPAELGSLSSFQKDGLLGFGTCALNESQARSLVKEPSVVIGQDKDPNSSLILNDDGIVAMLGYKIKQEKFEKFQSEGATSGKVRDQASHSLCWGYVVGDLVSSLRFQKNLERSNIQFCPWYLCAYCDPQMRSKHMVGGVEHICSGSSIENGLLHVKEHGIPVEVSEEFDCCDNNPPSADEPGMNNRRIKEVLRIESLEEALDYLKRNGQPIGADLVNFYRLLLTKNEIYDGPLSYKSPFYGYHGVIIESVKKVNGELVAVCKMSNGTDVGFKGYAYVSLATVYIPVGVDTEKQGLVRGSDKPVHLLTNFVVPVMEKGVSVDDDDDDDGNDGNDGNMEEEEEDDEEEYGHDKEEEKKKQHLQPFKRQRMGYTSLETSSTENHAVDHVHSDFVAAPTYKTGDMKDLVKCEVSIVTEEQQIEAQREYWRQVEESEGFDVEHIQIQPYTWLEGLNYFDCQSAYSSNPMIVLVKRYAMLGLHRYNMLEGTNLQFVSLTKFNTTMNMVRSYYISLIAHDPDPARPIHTPFQVEADEQRLGSLNLEISIARPKRQENDVPLVTTNKPFIPHYPGSVLERRKFPDWPSDDDFNDEKRFYKLKQLEWQSADWISLYLELVICATDRSIDEEIQLENVQILKVAIESTEVVERPSDKLKAKSLNVYITFKGLETVPESDEVGEDVERRAIIRRWCARDLLIRGKIW